MLHYVSIRHASLASKTLIATTSACTFVKTESVKAVRKITSARFQILQLPLPTNLTVIRPSPNTCAQLAQELQIHVANPTWTVGMSSMLLSATMLQGFVGPVRVTPPAKLLVSTSV